MGNARSFTATDWARAAVDAIAEAGVADLTVEGLARDLSITKGSFYWHYADRNALIAAALELWEREATTEVIETLRQVADPADRLRALFEVSFGDNVHGPVDGALVARVDDPVVGPVVRRVTARRIAFLDELYRELGLSPKKAAIQARITYCAYIGHFQVRRSLPDDPVLADPSRSYLRQVLATLEVN